jgi:hypothetical protein
MPACHNLKSRTVSRPHTRSGQENTTNAKKVEIAIDLALSNGYEDIDGRTGGSELGVYSREIQHSGRAAE